jgi:hypothetical protein
MKRKYDIELPYHIGGLFVGMAISKLEEAGDWDGLPIMLKTKMNLGQQGWDGVDLTQADLDTIPDHLWDNIAKSLNIGWKPA